MSIRPSVSFGFWVFNSTYRKYFAILPLAFYLTYIFDRDTDTSILLGQSFLGPGMSRQKQAQTLELTEAWDTLCPTHGFHVFAASRRKFWANYEIYAYNFFIQL